MVVTATHPPNGGQMTNAMIAEAADLSLRQWERFRFVSRRASPEILAALRAGKLKIGRAEQIVRLSPNRQMAELESVLNGLKHARPKWSIKTEIDRIAGQLNAM